MACMDVVCQIVRGDLEAHVVARTAEAIAFLDHRPVFPGHVLVAPVAHARTLLDLEDGLLVPVFSLARSVAAAFGPALGAEGSFLGINNEVSQSVEHLHVHVVPRRRGDGLRGFFWPRLRYGHGEAEEMARRLRAHLGPLGA